MPKEMPENLRKYYDEMLSGKSVEEPEDETTTAEETEGNNNNTVDDTEQNKENDSGERTTTDNKDGTPENNDGNVEDATARSQYEIELENRYKSIKGRYDKELPRLTKQIEASQKETERLEQIIKLLEEKLNRIGSGKTEVEDNIKTEVNSTTTVPTHSTSYITPQDREEYEETFIDFVMRAAKEAIAQEMPNYINNIYDKIDGLESKTIQTVEDRFYSDLGRLSPEFAVYNTDAGFNRWLDNPVDELSDITRRETFNRAVAKYDAERVAKFFNTYINYVANTASTVQTQPTVQQNSTPSYETFEDIDTIRRNMANNIKSELVAPNRTRSTTVPHPNQAQRKYTVKDLSDLNERVRKREIGIDEFERLYAEMIQNFTG